MEQRHNSSLTGLTFALDLALLGLQILNGGLSAIQNRIYMLVLIMRRLIYLGAKLSSASRYQIL